MTLNTYIEVKGDASLQDVFNTSVLSLLKAAGRGDEIDSVQIDDRWPNDGEICTKIGQGLPGIVLASPCEDSIMVSFDTAYGYRDSIGQDCSMLHVTAMIYMEEFLPVGSRIARWQNEYSGEWNDASNGIGPGVEEFLGHSDEAQKWFEEVLNHVTSGVDLFGGK